MWMLYKQRKKPYELKVLEYLDTRMLLSRKERQYYFSLKKWYEGEVLFDSLTEKLQCECFILNDLLLNSNNNTFQIDSLIITSDTIYLFEVKNHAGDYYYESDNFYNKKSNSEIINPLHQLKRKETLFHQLLFKLGYNLPINGSVVFINPEFTLYQSPLTKPIIYPTQIHQYLNELGNVPLKLAKGHKMLAEKLKSLHFQHTNYDNLPSYQYEKLKKGITCLKCNSFTILMEGSKCVCKHCGYIEKFADAVIRSIEEFKLLFPDNKITTSAIFDWCQVINSKKRIKGVLDKNYKRIGENRWIYYQ